MLEEEIFSRPGALPSTKCSLSGHTFFGKGSDICDTRTYDAHMFCASKMINYIYPCAQQREIYYLMYAIIRIANSTFHCHLPVITMIFNYSIYA